MWFKSRWVLLAVLCALVAFKLPHLFYPYYWDESWPYATAVKATYDHGFSLMPNAIDDNISRGHPLLFHNLASVWIHLFGWSRVTTHSFALLISLLLIVLVYEAGLQMFNRRVAVIAVLLLVCQELFLAQSSMLLPEVLVALLSFLSLYCYAMERYLLTGIFLSMLFLTKESGMMLGFVVGIDAWIAVFNKKIERKNAWQRLLSVLVPCLIIGTYFLLQKYLKGWFIFPFHAEIVEHSWSAFWYKFRMAALTSVVYADRKYFYFIGIAALAIAAAIKNKEARYLVYLLPFVIVYYFVDDMRAGRIMPSIPFFTLFVAAWLWCAHVVSKYWAEVQQQRFVFLAACFVLVYTLFSATNYFIYRYMLAAIVPMFFVAAALLDHFITRTYAWLYYLCLGGIGIVAAFTIDINGRELGAYNGMEVEQAVVDYLVKNNYYEKHIACQYLDLVHLTDAATGFLPHDRTFRHVKWAIDDSTDIAIFSNIERDGRYEQIKRRKDFAIIQRYERGGFWAELYKKVR